MDTHTHTGCTCSPLMSPEDVSAFLGIKVATLYAWRSRGQGPAALRVGRHTRYRREDVLSWLVTREAA